MITIIKKITYLVLIISCLFSFSSFAAHHNIADYQPIFLSAYNQENELRIVIRKFYRDETLYYLAVNPNTFDTELAPAVTFTKLVTLYPPQIFINSELSETPYLKILMQYTSPPYYLQNYGVTHAQTTVDGMFLTIDMCPSSKPFERDFFHKLIAISSQNHQPMPIAISITGLWITHHKEEFNWLIQAAKENKLAITWVNHSYNHTYYPEIPENENFLLLPHTDIKQEILETEKLLLEYGQLPSVFFRFPGLISDEKLVLTLRAYGLIPIGANAWLAKDEQARQGSFILVHGNSNEPQGIEKVLPLLNNPNSHWLPLEQAFVK